MTFVLGVGEQDPRAVGWLRRSSCVKMTQSLTSSLSLFIMLEALGALGTACVFLFSIWLSNRRRAQAFKGDESSANKMVLPCYRPLYIFLLTVYLLLAVGLALTFAFPMSVVSQFLAVQFISLVMLCLFSIVPLLLTQKSISPVAFQRTALIIGPWFLLCLMFWGFSDLRSATHSLQITFWIFSCLPAVVISVGILTKLIPSRIQMGSMSNRASTEYMLVYSVFFLGINISGVPLLVADDASKIWNLAALLAIFSIVYNQFFPLALHRTLLADTKFWRGLGRHNKAGLHLIGASSSGSINNNSKGGVDSSSASRVSDMVHKPTMDLTVVEGGLQKVLLDIGDITVDFAYLQLVAMIGEGASSKVYKGLLRMKPVAVKVFTPPEVTEELIDEFVQEAKLLASLQHENIVRFLGLCIRPPQIAMVMELCNHGNLKRSLVQYPDRWRPEWRVRACYDAARAVECLHALGYIHRDLKAENFFIGESRVVKLGDFGEATKQIHLRAGMQRSSLLGRRSTPSGGTGGAGGAGGGGGRMSIVGTVAYMAPELVAASKKYSEAIDIYSLGVTFWEIWTGEDPYSDLNTFQIYSAVSAGRRPEMPNNAPAGFKTIVAEAWAQQEEERPLASDLVTRLATLLRDEYNYIVPVPGYGSGRDRASSNGSNNKKGGARMSEDSIDQSPGSRMSRMLLSPAALLASAKHALDFSSRGRNTTTTASASASSSTNGSPSPRSRGRESAESGEGDARYSSPSDARQTYTPPSTPAPAGADSPPPPTDSPVPKDRMSTADYIPSTLSPRPSISPAPHRLSVASSGDFIPGAEADQDQDQDQAVADFVGAGEGRESLTLVVENPMLSRASGDSPLRPATRLNPSLSDAPLSSSSQENSANNG